MSFLRFLRSNYFYILWLGAYFFITWAIFGLNKNNFIIVSIIYGISITIALTPVGEVILRVIEGCRLPATREEKNYLLPIFEEVFQNAKEVNPSLNNHIKLYITDDMSVNAFAIGWKTIAVTKGAIETLSKEELKGVIAHELGHMTYGHTKGILLTKIGNILFTTILIVIKKIVKFLNIVTTIAMFFFLFAWFVKLVLVLFKLFLNLYTFIFVTCGELLLGINGRANEFQADKFAYRIGFGEELISALYTLQKISLESKMNFLERITVSHPNIARRIGMLESLQDQETQGIEECEPELT